MGTEDLQLCCAVSAAAWLQPGTTACCFHRDLVHKQQGSSMWSTSGMYSSRSIAAWRCQHGMQSFRFHTSTRCSLHGDTFKNGWAPTPRPHIKPDLGRASLAGHRLHHVGAPLYRTLQQAKCFAALKGVLSIALHLQNTNLEDVIGTNLRVKFLEADPETGRMVFSARRAQIFKQIGALSVSCWASQALDLSPLLPCLATRSHRWQFHNLHPVLSASASL